MCPDCTPGARCGPWLAVAYRHLCIADTRSYAQVFCEPGKNLFLKRARPVVRALSPQLCCLLQGSTHMQPGAQHTPGPAGTGLPLASRYTTAYTHFFSVVSWSVETW